MCDLRVRSDYVITEMRHFRDNYIRLGGGGVQLLETILQVEEKWKEPDIELDERWEWNGLYRHICTVCTVNPQPEV